MHTHLRAQVAVNPHFGSVFRTTTHRTRFFFQVLRYADLYAGSVTSFLKYPLDWCFYSARQRFAHEGNDDTEFNAVPDLVTLVSNSLTP
jgi:hypothetical protein